ncbi:hypothetical protein [Leisingera sp.]|uniref:hypothetical protein n=1 Tax=Leisingera sp. TaxID=1879318 RepID=UPI002B26A698|nr:hypothetical protein [Leisingera sp.]
MFVSQRGGNARAFFRINRPKRRVSAAAEKVNNAKEFIQSTGRRPLTGLRLTPQHPLQHVFAALSGRA